MWQTIKEKWRAYCKRFYTGRPWLVVLDVGLIFFIILLFCLWRLLVYYEKLPIEGDLNLPAHKVAGYKTMPLEWQTVFSSKIIDSSLKELTAEISYKNLASEPLIINYQCAEAKTHKSLAFRLEDDEATTSVNILEKQLMPQESGTSSLVLFLSDDLLIKGQTLNIDCQLVAQLGQQSWPAVHQQFSFKIAGEVKALAGGYFYTPEGDQVGIGPLPPTVGLPTSYLITWTLENQGGDLSDIQFSAQLAKDVTWQGEAGLTGGTLFYDASNHKVNWRIAEWPADVTKKQANFYISITPTKDMVGKVPLLLYDGQWRAKDSWSEKEWGGNLPDLSTNLEYDPHSAGQGEVVDILGVDNVIIE